MKFGLREDDIRTIQKTCEKFPQIKSVVIFGSRALGTFSTGSDIDLAIKATEDVSSKIRWILEEETLMPYFFDVINYEAISEQKLKEHIDKHGKELYGSS
jgi:predicted nucleotidyltransferase